MTTSRGTALVVDDHELFRIALSSILTSHLGYASILEAGNVEDAMQALNGNPDIDLVTMDLRLPGFEDFGVIGVIRDAYPGLTLVAVSGSASWNDAIECVRAGARGFVPKALSADEIASALRRVVAGEVFVPAPDKAKSTMFADEAPKKASEAGTGQHKANLTARQSEVYELLREGLSNKQIARRLGLSENTVKVHVFAVCRLLGVNDRRDAARLSA